MSPQQLKFFASRFTSRILATRSWGGRRKGPRSCSVSLHPTTGAGTPENAYAGTPAATGLVDFDSGYDSILKYLNILRFSPFLTPTFPPPPARTTQHTTHLSLQQNPYCSLKTHSDIAPEAAHLIPYSVASLDTSDAFYYSSPSLSGQRSATTCTKGGIRNIFNIS